MVYVQQQPLSNLNKSGSFIYKPQKILELCNEDSCVPVTMTLQSTKDMTKMYIPVLIKSENENEREISLLYALQNNKFYFLGGIQDDAVIKGKGEGSRGGDTLTIGREKISLQTNDIIYTKGLNELPFSPFTSDVFSDFTNMFGAFNKDFFIKVNDTNAITLKYTDTNVSGIQFVICDNANLCSESKRYDINRQDGFIPDNNSKSHFVINNTNSKEHNENNSYTYINYEYDYQLEYPLNWVSRTNDINKDRFLHIFTSDSMISSVFPINDIQNITYFPNLELFIETENSVNSESLTGMLEHIKGYYDINNYITIRNITNYSINGNQVFKYW